jgi:two-component system chemotaxis response regulator CheY
LARKILLADDSVTAQNMGRKILADAGYEVITVNNGSAALKKIAEHKPDLIILDVYMPGYSGLEVCQRLKEAQETSRVPVLLTVGKLEPFKPEEAKRVRADGFIVKPFEASELLSALSKLEDKIVPRAEAAKPGRFARANAALDEGRYDKTVAVDEDSGWKNRIAFPSKKKEKAVAEDGDDPAIYNAMNKDLRTVVEHKPAERPHDVRAEETKVDLGALAPEGLPKDVTPEEIAALAAAAAQVKGKIAEIRQEEPVAVEAKAEPRAEAIAPAQSAAELASPVAPAPAAEAFAGQASEDKLDAKREQPEQKTEAAKEAVSDDAPSAAVVTAAIAGLEPDAGTSLAASSGNGSWSHSAHERTADEPVTMAAAAGAGSVAATSRWTAVSLALAPEESSISLEHEMQKAYAAFAAAENGHAGSVAEMPETRPEPAALAATTEISAQADVAAEPVVSIPANPAPEAIQPLSDVADAASEAISAAVKELEAVAASYLEQKASSEPELVPVEKAAAAAQPAPEPVQAVEASIAENPIVAAAEPAAEIPSMEAAQPEAPQIEHEKDAVPVPQGGSETNAVTPELTLPAIVSEIQAEQTPASQVPEAAAVTAGEPAARGTGETAKKEFEIAANTAAAWASWRRIRESGDPKAASQETSQKEVEPPQDAAAMAVAAGAEKAPEEASPESGSDPEAIASIVDSVLAEMRPKIYEEISRKMGKKK